MFDVREASEAPLRAGHALRDAKLHILPPGARTPCYTQTCAYPWFFLSVSVSVSVSVSAPSPSLSLCLPLSPLSLSLSLSLSRSLVLVLGSLGGAAGAAFVVPGELALSMRTESGQCTRKDSCGPSCQVFAWPVTDRQFHRLEMQGARSSDSTGHAHFGRKATSSATPTAALVSQRLPP